MLPSVATSVFGSISGAEVVRYDLQCPSLTASFINYGATLLSVKAPGRSGVLEEVCLQHPTLPEIREKSPYYGSTVGRVANRIAGGRFALDGRDFQLERNNGPNTLHGGVKAFDKQLWSHEPVSDSNSVGVRFSYSSPDGEEGFPGAVRVTATYSITMQNELLTEYEACLTGDAEATPINLTNHAYWNLSGGLKGDVTDHDLQLHCSRYLPVDAAQIPTGELAAAAGTPFDFAQPTRLGGVIPRIDGGGKPGLDHCFVVDGAPTDALSASVLRSMATLSHAPSGRRMQLHGTQPGLQVYTNNWGSEDEGDAPHCQHWAVALETQAFPNAVNMPAWAPQVVLRRGQKYRHASRHTFSTF
eukprot:TRINITY_DN3684_c0_g1_i2.p1 TRINITY_DN3684_c0_g1~~TRINITY_DN3684_c0_g1_i2.p1  ORF type:complete len:395 (+),score=76.17 TRINITY_DN3684_c0_g1_i2:113-1186(+)